MALYTVRSERMFCEQLDYNLLFRWFLDMNMEEASFVPTVFTKNRECRGSKKSLLGSRRWRISGRLASKGSSARGSPRTWSAQRTT